LFEIHLGKEDKNEKKYLVKYKKTTDNIMPETSSLKSFGEIYIKAIDAVRAKTPVKPEVGIVFGVHPDAHTQSIGKPESIG
jgi:hypothetical protein